MKEMRLQILDKTVVERKTSTQQLLGYWETYSGFSTWQFWFLLGMVIIPLTYLILKIDKDKIFHIGFYGYSIHVVFAYIDIFGVNLGLWSYPYQLIPPLQSLSLDSAFVPVAFMLVYQWTLNQQKNFYLYSTIMAVVFAFLFKPIFVGLGLFRMYSGINYVHLFIAYVLVFLSAKLLTWVFLKLQQGRLVPVREV